MSRTPTLLLLYYSRASHWVIRKVYELWIRAPTHKAVVWELNCRAETFDVRNEIQNVEMPRSL